MSVLVKKKIIDNSEDAIHLSLFNSARNYFRIKNFNKMTDQLKSITELNIDWIKEEIEFGTGNSKFLKYALKKKVDYIVGIFDCPYNLDLDFEYAKIEDVKPTIDIELSTNNIRCVKQLLATEGMGNEQVVAIFSENFRSVIPDAKDPVFYFVDKFTTRHLKYTRPFLSTHLKDFFHPLLTLNQKKIEVLVTNWVLLHENSHRGGFMPIPQYLYEKSNRYTAALEELRADLVAISWCLNTDNQLGRDVDLTAMYILAERLVVYPLIRSIYNFDTISSILFWKFLNTYGGFKVLNQKNEMIKMIDELLKQIEVFEKDALLAQTKQLRKNKLKTMIIQYIGNYEEEYEKYFTYWGTEWKRQ